MRNMWYCSTLLIGFALVTSIVASPLTLGRRKLPKVQGGEDPDPVIRERRIFVKQMMKDAWDDYARWAWGENELRPVSQTGQDGGIFGDSQMGATIVDSLDTLFIMEMLEEYAAARDYVENELDFNQNATVSVFETNIRFVGGLLSAYALTEDPLYIERAVDITTRLLPAFDTPTGIPYGWVNVATGESNSGTNAVLAEFGTLHLEFMYLSEVTENPIFREKVETIRAFMRNITKPNGLYPNYLNIVDGQFSGSHISMGAMGDSFYEYLLKAAIQLGDQEARRMYDEATNAFARNGLIRLSRQNRLLFIAESNGGQIEEKVGHLACFAGGMFALGAHVDPNNPNARRDAEIGRNFTDTCRESYIRTATKIGPEVFWFTEELEAEASFSGERYYILRPEVVESYFVLYRITGDTKYREWAWEAAQSIERYCKAGPGRGYSGIRDTNSTNPGQDDVQQTFFLAETLKYLYLIFSTDDLISLDEWVFNTECHPLPIKATNPLFKSTTRTNNYKEFAQKILQ